MNKVLCPLSACFEVRFYRPDEAVKFWQFESQAAAGAKMARVKTCAGGTFTEVVSRRAGGVERPLMSSGALAAKESLLPLFTDAHGFIVLRYGTQEVRF